MKGIVRKLRSGFKLWYANHLAVPGNALLGIRIVRVDPASGQVTVKLKNRKNIHNAAGTVHGAAIFALAETVHGTAVMWQHSPRRHRMFTKTASLRFVAPGRGELFTTYALSDEIRSRLETELGTVGRCEVTAESRVRDANGAEVATLDATYVVLRSHPDSGRSS